MARCEHCGNEYDRAFTVTDADGKSHTFDSFECAIHLMAPQCSHCGCRIIGHGVVADDEYFCCANCARESGVSSLVDHA